MGAKHVEDGQMERKEREAEDEAPQLQREDGQGGRQQQQQPKDQQEEVRQQAQGKNWNLK